MAVTDKVLGLSMLTVAAIVFTYYTLWVIITPFVDADHPLQAYFPERYWAVALPTVALVAAFAVAGTLIGYVMISSKKSR